MEKSCRICGDTLECHDYGGGAVWSCDVHGVREWLFEGSQARYGLPRSSMPLNGAQEGLGAKRHAAGIGLPPAVSKATPEVPPASEAQPTFGMDATALRRAAQPGVKS